LAIREIRFEKTLRVLRRPEIIFGARPHALQKGALTDVMNSARQSGHLLRCYRNRTSARM